MGSLRVGKAISRPRWTAATRGVKRARRLNSWRTGSSESRLAEYRSKVGVDARVFLYHRDERNTGVVVV
jgi:hypothetical protein